MFQYGSQRQMFLLLNEHQLDISDFEFKLQEILPALETARMVFKSPEDIQNIVRSLGSTTLNSLQYKTDYKPSKIQQVQVPSLVPRMPTQFTLHRRLDIIRSEEVLITCMCIPDDNCLLLCNQKSNVLLVYSDSGDYLQDCKLSGEPCDIAVIPGENKAVVTLPYQSLIKFIDIITMKASSKYSIPVGSGVAIVKDTICVGGYERGYLHIYDK